MKKISILFLAFIILIFSFAGCSEKTTTSKDKNTSKNSDNSVQNASSTSDTDTVVVPNVVGMDKDEAIKKLEGLGLKVEIMGKNQLLLKDEFKNYNIGEIYEQNIATGTLCKKSTQITLCYVSDKPEFEYIINSDNTIRLVVLSVFLPENKNITIPSKYNNYQVSEIDLTAMQLGEDFTLQIPKNIKIIGQTNCQLEII